MCRDLSLSSSPAASAGGARDDLPVTLSGDVPPHLRPPRDFLSPPVSAP